MTQKQIDLLWMRFQMSVGKQKFWIKSQLDKSRARWRLKSPQSLSGRFLHLTFQGHTCWSLRPSVHYICALFILWQSNNRWLRYRKFQIWPLKLIVKVMAKLISDGDIWGIKFNQYVCFLFHENWTIFGLDIVNSIFDLEDLRSRSCLRSNHMVVFEAESSIDVFVFCFVAIRSFLVDIHSEFHIWPWKFKVNITAKVKSDGHIWGIEFKWYACF